MSSSRCLSPPMYVCACYRCVSGLPVEGCGSGKTPEWNYSGSKCAKAPSCSTRQNKLHRQQSQTTTTPPQNELALPHNQPPASACSLRLLLWDDGGSKGLITRWVLFVFICLPYFIVRSGAGPPPRPAPNPPHNQAHSGAVL